MSGMPESPQRKSWPRLLVPALVGTYLDEKLLLFLVGANIGFALWLAKQWGGDPDGIRDFGLFAAMSGTFAALVQFDLFQIIIGSKTRRGSTIAWKVFLPAMVVTFGAGYFWHEGRLEDAQRYEQSHKETQEMQDLFNTPDVRAGMKIIEQDQESHAATSPSSSQPAVSP